MLFSKRLEKIALEKESKLVLALDVTKEVKPGVKASIVKRQILSKALEIFNQVSPFIVALKINFHLLLPLDLYGEFQELVNTAKDEKVALIADCKVNDIGSTNTWVAKHLFNAGFDAVIANPIAGWEGGLDSLFREARKREKGILLLCYMSHPGAREGYGLNVNTYRGLKPLYILFAENAVKWGADGVIVGATHPEKIKEVKRVVGEIPIFSPGVVTQGGDPATALKAGADYLIVGRYVTESKKPGETARGLANLTKQWLKL